MRDFYKSRLLKFFKPEDAEEMFLWLRWMDSKTTQELSDLYDEAYNESLR